MFYVFINGKFVPSNNLPPTSTNPNTIDRRERRKRSKMNCDNCLKPSAYCNTFPLAHCKTAVPCTGITYSDPYNVKEEGKTPMRYNDNYASASATVATQPSDSAVARDYLLSRLAKAEYPKKNDFEKLYNLYVETAPKTYVELIAAIKDGAYTIDPKIAKKVEQLADDDYPNYNGPFWGIKWTGGPQPDPEGYAAAIEQMKTQYTATKDIIMTSDAAAGLTALQAFEAWVPATTAVVN